MAKKNQGMSPTFKAGLIVIIVLGLIWAVTTVNDPWYETPDDPIQPIAEAEEVATLPVEEVEAVSEPAEEVVEVVEEAEVEEEVVVEEAEAEIQLPDEALMMDDYDYMVDPLTITDEALYWSFRRNTDHTPVQGYSEGVDLESYDAFYIVDSDEKVVYLTFDEGYENGYTSLILDTLSDNNVQATFFVTQPYILSQPELTKRMKDEGHIVGNHSVHHYDGNTTVEKYSQLSVEDTIAELEGVATAMKEQTGYPIDMFFRPPGGLFSERSLYITRQQGYRTVFWSMAYQDWYVDAQPGKEAAYDHVMTNVHPGAVILLHAVSESNTQALDDIIKDLKADGYRFGSLYEVSSKYTTQ